MSDPSDLAEWLNNLTLTESPTGGHTKVATIATAARATTPATSDEATTNHVDGYIGTAFRQWIEDRADPATMTYISLHTEREDLLAELRAMPEHDIDDALPSSEYTIRNAKFEILGLYMAMRYPDELEELREREGGTYRESPAFGRLEDMVDMVSVSLTGRESRGKSRKIVRKWINQVLTKVDGGTKITHDSTEKEKLD